MISQPKSNFSYPCYCTSHCCRSPPAFPQLHVQPSPHMQPLLLDLSSPIGILILCELCGVWSLWLVFTIIYGVICCYLSSWIWNFHSSFCFSLWQSSTKVYPLDLDQSSQPLLLEKPVVETLWPRTFLLAKQASMLDFWYMRSSSILKISILTVLHSPSLLSSKIGA